MKLTREIIENIEKQYNKISDLISEYSKNYKPEEEYLYFDGNYLSLFWKNKFASIQFVFYQNSIELYAYKDDDSEWLEVIDGRKSYRGTLNKRENFQGEISEEIIKEVFSWFFNTRYK